MCKELIVCVVSASSPCLQPTFFSPERHIRRRARHFVPHTHIYTHTTGRGKKTCAEKLHNFHMRAYYWRHLWCYCFMTKNLIIGFWFPSFNHTQRCLCCVEHFFKNASCCPLPWLSFCLCLFRAPSNNH